jgi:prepilin-type N-terminal cleavage/methylation domain-containing protein
MVKSSNSSRKAFTLIELLVVVLILGILVAVAIPSYMSSIKTSRTNTSHTNARMIATAAQAIAVKTGAYPADFANTSLIAELGGVIPAYPCVAAPGNTVTDWGYAVSGSQATVAPVTTNCDAIPSTVVKINP